jgi:glycosyltransferase involved in cell wall biosynthesis
LRQLSIGLVHDYLLVRRGAERTFAAIARCFPEAPIYTLLYDPSAMAHDFAQRDVTASRLQALRVRQRGFRTLLPLFPMAAEALPVHEHDLLLTSSSAFAHGIRPRPGALQVCYCHSPFRYAWHEYDRTLGSVRRPLRPVLSRALSRVRRWDLEASGRVGTYIANSRLTQRRVHDFYGRDSAVIHPPVEVERFAPGKAEDFFLVVGEVTRHKQTELALEAARASRTRIKVVGEGPELPRLREEYSGTAEFLGRLSDAELGDLYARARALVVPNVEEFGIAAVEAQAAGRPVVAANAGGTRETVIPGTTGVLVEPGSVDALATALKTTEFEAFEPAQIRQNAERFSLSAFTTRLESAVAQAAEAHFAR